MIFGSSPTLLRNHCFQWRSFCCSFGSIDWYIAARTGNSPRKRRLASGLTRYMISLCTGISLRLALTSFFTSRYSPSFRCFVAEQAGRIAGNMNRMILVKSERPFIYSRMSIISTFGCSSGRKVKKPLLIAGFSRILSK